MSAPRGHSLMRGISMWSLSGPPSTGVWPVRAVSARGRNNAPCRMRRASRFHRRKPR